MVKINRGVFVCEEENGSFLIYKYTVCDEKPCKFLFSIFDDEREAKSFCAARNIRW
jgi:hypothetical protein